MALFSDTELERLFKRIAADDENAFNAVFNRNYDRIYSTALQYCKTKDLAEDISQQVFFILWEQRKKLRDVENPYAWLWGITRNQAVKTVKKEIRRESYLAHIKELFESETDTPHDQLVMRQKQELINRIIATLPPRQQQVYRMSRYNAATYAEIAKTLNISTETVKEHIKKALKTIRKLLASNKEELLLLLAFLIK